MYEYMYMIYKYILYIMYFTKLSYIHTVGAPMVARCVYAVE